MKKLQKVAFILYPLLIAILLPFFFLRTAHSGHIRTLHVTQDTPVTVRLAIGRTTAISFSSRPEKVVPGSPQALDINFLGKDLTIRPLDHRPGNLLIYTKSARYVVLLKAGSDQDYDDVVALNVSGTSIPVRLSEDSYRAIGIRISEKWVRDAKTATATLKSNELELSGAQFFELIDSFPRFRCTGCLERRHHGERLFLCSKPILKLGCRADGKRDLTLEKEDP